MTDLNMTDLTAAMQDIRCDGEKLMMLGGAIMAALSNAEAEFGVDLSDERACITKAAEIASGAYTGAISKLQQKRGW